jgi:hypothetical protein
MATPALCMCTNEKCAHVNGEGIERRRPLAGPSRSKYS